MGKERIILFGGAFNPIHNGHLFMAEYVRSCLKMDNTIFIPSRISPHKNINMDPGHRTNMIYRATENNYKLRVSEVEILRHETSYTIDTLRYFSTTHPLSEIFFMMGSDALFNLHTWKDYKEILNYKLIVVDRWGSMGGTSVYPKYALEYPRTCCRIGMLNPLPNLVNINHNVDYDADIISLAIPQMNISSTMIRNLIKMNLSISYLLPNNVISYIKENNLYL